MLDSVLREMSHVSDTLFSYQTTFLPGVQLYMLESSMSSPGRGSSVSCGFVGCLRCRSLAVVDIVALCYVRRHHESVVNSSSAREDRSEEHTSELQSRVNL